MRRPSKAVVGLGVGAALVFLGLVLLVFNRAYQSSGKFRVHAEHDITENTTLRVVSIGGRQFVVVNGVNKLAVCPW